MAVMIAPHDEDRIDALANQVAVLAVRMDEGFKRVDERFEQVDKRFEQVDKRFEQVDKRFEQVDKRFEKLEDRLHHMQWTLIVIAGGIIAALITAPHL
jgi:archaellum component FlaC